MDSIPNETQVIRHNAQGMPNGISKHLLFVFDWIILIMGNSDKWFHLKCIYSFLLLQFTDNWQVSQSFGQFHVFVQ